MNATHQAPQDRRYDVAARLFGKSRAGAIAHIRALGRAARQHLQGQVDWVIAYENEEVH